jgi:hypothetical protein
MTQHPVGQGGFFYGELACRGPAIRWVYDCGSNQADFLSREIERIHSDAVVDLLFVSHLDSDHVSGIDRLLGQVSIEEVVLPYLEFEDLVVSIVDDLEHAKLTGSFNEFANDPAGWFIDRGVKRVTFVRSRDIDGDEGPPPPVPDPPERPELPEGRIDLKWTPLPRIKDQREGATVREVESNAIITTSVASLPLNWIFIPFAHRPSLTKLADFKQRIRREFPKLTLPQITAEAKTAAGRKALRRCYDVLWKDHNLVSMALYSGPIGKWRRMAYVGISRYGAVGTVSTGWLNTGDAALGGLKRREAFTQHYRRIADSVGILQLPHHGSFDNFHSDLLKSFEKVEYAFVAVGKNSYGHPHPGVVRAASAGKAQFHRVTGQPRSELSIESDLPRSR